MRTKFSVTFVSNESDFLPLLKFLTFWVTLCWKWTKNQESEKNDTMGLKIENTRPGLAKLVSFEILDKKTKSKEILLQVTTTNMDIPLEWKETKIIEG